MQQHSIPQDERAVAEHLVRAAGQEPARFQIDTQPGGMVRVVGPRGTACYPRDQWLSRFSRHLERHFFDPAPPARGPRFSRKHRADEAGSVPA